MPTNEIEYYQGQPIAMYKVNPTEDEIADGMTPWETSAYHKINVAPCIEPSADYCHPVRLDLDTFTLQFKARTMGNEVLQGFFNPLLTGTNSAVTSGFLTDVGANFVINGVQDNEIVENTTTPDSSFVIDVTDNDNLELNEDIFLATPENYSVYLIKTNGSWKYNSNTGLIYMSTSSPTDIYFESALTTTAWYKVTITITDITSGSITIKLGTNSIAILNSVGTHIVYGQCTANTTFTITASATFLGSFQDDINIYQLQTTYGIVLFDLDGNPILITDWTESSDSLTIGNIFINTPWDGHVLNPPCGKYIIGISSQTFCDGEMITNGEFNSATGWTASDNQIQINLVTKKAEFNLPPAGEYLINNLACDLIEGHSYTLTWIIGPLSSIQSGTYKIIVNNVVVSPTYNAGAQSGTISLTFTSPSSFGFLHFYTNDNSCQFTLDNISMIDNDVAFESDMDGLSECYCVCDTIECTTLIEFSADKPTFGNFFDSNNERMFFRVYGRLRNSNNDDLELNSFKTTVDTQIQPYLNMNKAEELALQPVPDWVHASLSTAISHPIVYIDGVRYVRIGAYEPGFGNTELSDVVVKVARRNQRNLRNNY